MKEYEKHAVKAAMTGSVEEALHALMVNPLVFDYDKAYLVDLAKNYSNGTFSQDVFKKRLNSFNLTESKLLKNDLHLCNYQKVLNK